MFGSWGRALAYASLLNPRCWDGGNRRQLRGAGIGSGGSSGATSDVGGGNNGSGGGSSNGHSSGSGGNSDARRPDGSWAVNGAF